MGDTVTTADDLSYEDEFNEPSADAARKRAAFEQRQKAREDERKELAELREFKATTERRDALGKATADLNATGPLGAFLRTYTGDPAAAAIKAAVAADPDFRDLITFTPDPRDAAAAEQAANGTRLAGGAPVTGQITLADYDGWALDKRLRFREKHSEQFETLKTGNPVPAPAGWA